ncbi:MAG: dephospho-CoA kinase [Opitutales bacterium]|nr:dephospho-CoA kinase [Opitutales bacterium]
MKIALTGAMGCGKSATRQAFEMAGTKVLDADKLAHFVLENDSTVIKSVKALLGDDTYENGKPNRQKIAQAVFSDSKKLQALEEIIHPAIEKIWTSAMQDNQIVVVEIPLLFEKKLEKHFDICVSVFCSEALRVKRLIQRGMNLQEILKRDAFQLSATEKAKRADIVLFNEGSLDFLNKQVAFVLSRLK